MASSDARLEMGGVLQLPVVDHLARFTEELAADPNVPDLPRVLADIHAMVSQPTVTDVPAVIESVATQFASYFDNDTSLAIRTLSLAYNLRTRSDLLWGALRDTFSPLVRTNPLLVADTPPAFAAVRKLVAAYNNLPGQSPEQRQELGLMDFVEAPYSRSILAPTAYLVDLLRLVSSKEGLDESLDAFQLRVKLNDPDVEKYLRYRRPDIYNLALSPSNTNDTVPYVAVINTALEGIIGQNALATNLAETDSYSILANTDFPLLLPFHQPLQRVHHLLDAIKLPLENVISSTTRPSLGSLLSFSPTTNIVHNDQERARRLLRLSPREWKLITEPDAKPTRVAALFGSADTTPSDLLAFLKSMSDVKVLTGRLGVTRDELTEIVEQDLSNAELVAGLSRAFFVNDTTDSTGYLRIRLNVKNPYEVAIDEGEVVENLSWGRLDRLQRFVRLAKRLDGWSFSDLDWALRAVNANLANSVQRHPFLTSRALGFDGVDDLIVVPLTSTSNSSLPFQDKPLKIEAWVQPSNNPPKQAEEFPQILFGLWKKTDAVLVTTSNVNNPKSVPATEQLDAVWLIFLNDANQVCVWLADGSSAVNFLSSSSLAPGQFSHVCVNIAEDKTISLLVNGNPSPKAEDAVEANADSEANTVNTTQPIPVLLQVVLNNSINADLNGSTKVGALHFGQFFAGALKEVRIWKGIADLTENNTGNSANVGTQATGNSNEVYSQALNSFVNDVRANMYKALTGYESSLLGYWRMDSTTVGRVIDSSKNNYSGVLGLTSNFFTPKWYYSNLAIDGHPVRSALDFSNPDGFETYLSAQFGRYLEPSENVFALSFWVSLNDVADHSSVVELICGPSASAGDYRFVVQLDEGSFKLSLMTSTASTMAPITYDTSVAKGDLYFVSLWIGPMKSALWARPESSTAAGWTVGVNHNISAITLRGLNVGVGVRGQISDMKLWEVAKSEVEADGQFDPLDSVSNETVSIVSHWPMRSDTIRFDEDAGRLEVEDVGFNANHLFGRPKSNFEPVLEPETSDVYSILEGEKQKQNRGTALSMDSKTSVLITGEMDEQKFALGSMNEGAVSFWFKCEDVSPFEKQLLFATGNDDVGVTVYVEKNKNLVFVVWQRVLDDFSLNFSSVLRPFVQSHDGNGNSSADLNTWNRVAFSFKRRVENSALFDVAVYLDGTAIGTIENVPLPPTGNIILGGIPTSGDESNGWIVFKESEGAREDLRNNTFFSGLMKDFVLWTKYLGVDDLKSMKVGDYFERQLNYILARISLNRVEEITEETSTNDTISGSSMSLPVFSGYTGSEYPKNMKATLIRQKNVLIATGDSVSSSLYSFVTLQGPSQNEVTVRGRMRTSKTSTGIGIIMHRSTEVSPIGVSSQRGVVLVGYAMEGSLRFMLRELSESGDVPSTFTGGSELVLPVNRWVSFELLSKKQGANTIIQGKVWEQGALEPESYSLTLTSVVRAHQIIGLWGFGQGKHMFDDLFAFVNGTSVSLFFENFEDKPVWEELQTDVLLLEKLTEHVPKSALGWEGICQRRLVAEMVPGSNSLLEFWNQTGTIEVVGELQFADDLGGVGVYFGCLPRSCPSSAFGAFDFDVALVRSPFDTALLNNYHGNPYCFRLEYYNRAGHFETADIDSFVPVNGKWYKFKVVFSFNTYRSIKVKMWEFGSEEPADFELERGDFNVCSKGSLGLMGTGAGKKYFEGLSSITKRDGEADVKRSLTAGSEQLTPESNKDGFGIIGRSSVHGTDADSSNIGYQTLYCPRTADGSKRGTSSVALDHYSVQGSFFRASSSAAVGITVNSHLPVGNNRFYDVELTAEDENSMVLSGFGDRAQPSEVNYNLPNLGLGWHNFHLQSRGAAITGKVWKTGEMEPAKENFGFVDHSEVALTSGTFGLWSNWASTMFANVYLREEVMSSMLEEASSWKHYITELIPGLFYNSFKLTEDVQKFSFKDVAPNTVVSPAAASNRQSFFAIYSQTSKLELGGRCTIRISDYKGQAGIVLSHTSLTAPALAIVIGTNAPGRKSLGYLRIRQFTPSQNQNVGETADCLLSLNASNRRTSASLDLSPDEEVHLRFDTKVVRDISYKTRLRIRAKVWKIGEPEPSFFPLVAYSFIVRYDSDFGFYSAGAGEKTFSALELYSEITALGEGRNVSSSWIDVKRLDAAKTAPGPNLFETIDMADTSIEYIQKLDNAPVVDPLQVLSFRGQQVSMGMVSDTSFLTTSVEVNSAWIASISIFVPTSDGERPDGPVFYFPELGAALFVERISSTSILLVLRYGANSHNHTVSEITGSVSLALAYNRSEDSEEFVLYVNGQLDSANRVKRGRVAVTSSTISVYIGLGRNVSGTEIESFKGHLYNILVEQGTANPTSSLITYKSFRERAELGAAAAEKWNESDSGLSALYPNRLVGCWPELPGSKFLFKFGGDTSLWTPRRSSSLLPKPALSIDKNSLHGVDALQFEGAVTEGVQLEPHWRKIDEDEELRRRTIEVTFRATNALAGERSGQNLYRDGQVQLSVKDGAVCYAVKPNEGEEIYLFSTEIESGEWYSATMVWSASEDLRSGSMLCYLNGNSVGVVPGKAVKIDSSARPTIGGDGFSGSILYVFVSSEALDEDSIRTRAATPIKTRAFNNPMDKTQININPSSIGNLLTGTGTFSVGPSVMTTVDELVSVPLDSALTSIAFLNELKKSSNLDVVKAISTWGQVKDYGSDSFFDSLFNSQTTDENVSVWAFGMKPISFHESFESRLDWYTASRLKHASSASTLSDLMKLLAVSGFENRIDGPFLQRFVNTVRLTRLLGVTADELVQLRYVLGLKSTLGPKDVYDLVQLNKWLDDASLSIASMLPLMGFNDALSPEAVDVSTSSVLQEQSSFQLTEESLTSGGLSSPEASALIAKLQTNAVFISSVLQDLTSFQLTEESLSSGELSGPEASALIVQLRKQVDEKLPVLDENFIIQQDPFEGSLGVLVGGNKSWSSLLRNAFMSDTTIGMVEEFERLLDQNGLSAALEEFGDGNPTADDLLRAFDGLGYIFGPEMFRAMSSISLRASLGDSTSTTITAPAESEASEDVLNLLASKIFPDWAQKAINAQEIFVKHRNSTVEAVNGAFEGAFDVDAEIVNFVLASEQTPSLYALVSQSYRADIICKRISSKSSDDLEQDVDSLARIIDSLSASTKNIVQVSNLVEEFELTQYEAEELLNNRDIFGVTSGLEALNFSSILALLQYNQMKRFISSDPSGRFTEEQQSERLVEVLKASEDEKAAKIADLFSMQQSDVEWLLMRASGSKSIDKLWFVFELHNVSSTLSANVRTLFTLSDESSIEGMEQFGDAVTQGLQEAVSENGADILKEVSDTLLLRSRDALLQYAISIIATDPSQYNLTSVILGEYLLLDVETGIRVLVSPVQQAIQSVQLYIHRTILGLERDIQVPPNVSQQWDTWLQAYRVWEAARRVYLYPENYVEPDLRTNATDAYDTLLDKVSSGGDEETIFGAVIDYVGDLERVLSRLRIVGAGFGNYGKEEDGLKRLTLVSRNAQSPPDTYVRHRLTNSEGHEWGRWEKVEQSITSHWISPVYAFGMLHLFWVNWTSEQVQHYVFDDERWEKIIHLRDELSKDKKNELELELINAMIDNVEDREIRSAEEQQAYNGPDQCVRIFEMAYLDEVLYENISTEDFRIRKEISKPRLVSIPMMSPEIQYVVQQPTLAWGVPQSIGVNVSALTGEFKLSRNKWVAGEHQKPEWQRPYCIPLASRQASQQGQVQTITNPIVLDNIKSTDRLPLDPALTTNGNAAFDFLAKFSITDADGFVELIKDMRENDTEKIYAVASWSFYLPIPICNIIGVSENNDISVEIVWNELITKFDEMIQNWKVDAADQTEEDQNTQSNLNRLNDFLALEKDDAWIANAPDVVIGNTPRSILNLSPGEVPEDDLKELSISSLLDASLKLKTNTSFASRMNWQFVWIHNTTNDDENDSIPERFPGPTIASTNLNVWTHYVIHFLPSNKCTLYMKRLGIDVISRQEWDNIPSDYFVTKDVSYTVGGTLRASKTGEIFTGQLSLAKLWLLGENVSDLSSTPAPLFDSDTEAFRQSQSKGGDYILARSRSLTNDQENQFFVQVDDLTLKERAPTELDKETIIVVLNDQILSLKRNAEQSFSVSFNKKALLNVPVFEMIPQQQSENQGRNLYASISIAVRDKPTLISGTLDFFSGSNKFDIDDYVVYQNSRNLANSPSNRVSAISNLEWTTSTVQPVQNSLGLFILETNGDTFIVDAFKKEENSVFGLKTELSSYFVLKNAAQGYILDLEGEGVGDTSSGVDDYYFTIQRLSSSTPGEFLGRLSSGGTDSLYDKSLDSDVKLASSSAQVTEETTVWFQRYPRSIKSLVNEDVTITELADGTFQTNSTTSETISGGDIVVLESGKIFPLWGSDTKILHSQWKSLRKDFFDNDATARTIDVSAFNSLDIQGINEFYFWEVFMYVPWLIANGLNSSGQFQRAKAWYEYIFRPIRSSWSDSDYNPWVFLPFRNQFRKRHVEVDGTLAILNNTDMVAKFRESPFDAHNIAYNRRFAYQKAIFQKYVLNMLDWGDSLFIDSRESINQALIFYFTAAKVLGPRPNALKSDREIEDTSPRVIEALRAGSNSGQTQLLGQDFVVPAFISESMANPIALMISFVVTENDQVLSLWDTLQDRLFKIRNSLNIEGVFRQLALFDPPIDPASIVSAVAGGATPLGAVASLQRAVPHYRFSYMLDQAKEAIEVSISLGNDLLAALESRDAETLALLEGNQETITNEFEREIALRELAAAKFEVQEARDAIVRLETRIGILNGFLEEGEAFEGQFDANPAAIASKALDVGKATNDIFESVAKDRIPKEEKKNVEIKVNATIRQATAVESRQSASFESSSRSVQAISRTTNRNAERSAMLSAQSQKSKAKLAQRQLATTATEVSLTASAGAAEAAPNVATGTAGLGPLASVEFGGQKIAKALSYAGEAIALGTAIADIVQTVKETKAQEEGQKAEWRLERDALKLEVIQARNARNAQIERALGAEVALDLVIVQGVAADVKLQTLRAKFTNEQLYSWMVNQLTRLYRRSYNTAVAMARQAERTLQFELPTDRTFISGQGWSDAKRGLLATHSLQAEIRRMSNYHTEQDSRFLQIERRVSLRDELPNTLTELKESGLCALRLPEEMFDRDFPGHYFRVITTVAVSVQPTGSGEIESETSLRATLTQTSNRVIMTPDIETVKYVIDPKGKPTPDLTKLRSNWRANQTVALSKWRDDTGMFVVDFFFDDRYFSFEGTGVVSTWELSISPQSNPRLQGVGPFALNNIDDVVLLIKYQSKADMGQFRMGVLDALQELQE